MNPIRDFIHRLAVLVERKSPQDPIVPQHRRIVVPEAGRFSFDGTVVRTLPIEPVVAFERPGGPSEVVQLLEWFDTPGDETSSGFRENDLGVDLAATLALATGRRVAFANEVPLRYAGAQWTAFLEVGHSVDGELYGPVEDGVRERFIRITKVIAALPEKQGIALGGAIRMRNAACCLVDTDHSSGYGLLVVALETLSRAFGNPPSSWTAWDRANDWDRFFRSIAVSDQQADSLRQELMANKQIRLRRTFVDYAADNLTPSFWNRTYYQFTPNFVIDAGDIRRDEGTWNEMGPISLLVPPDAAELRRRLGRSYDARSEVFHESARLDQIVVIPLPGEPKQPLPFAGLRRVLDHLLWHEIGIAASGSPNLPDFQVVHQAPNPK